MSDPSRPVALAPAHWRSIVVQIAKIAGAGLRSQSPAERSDSLAYIAGLAEGLLSAPVGGKE